jgi:fructose-1,6-bisphosphatase/inositol monophosphatase family enzyme
MAAGLLLVCEAGGVATDLAGAPARVGHGGMICGNPHMHRWLFDHIINTTAQDSTS